MLLGVLLVLLASCGILTTAMLAAVWLGMAKAVVIICMMLFSIIVGRVGAMILED